jgi:hypothetical protein
MINPSISATKAASNIFPACRKMGNIDKTGSLARGETKVILDE